MVVCVGNRLFHLFHVFVTLVCGATRRHSAGPKSLPSGFAGGNGRRSVGQVQEVLTDPGQQPHLGVSGRVFFKEHSTFLLGYFLDVRYLMVKPCLLIWVGLSSLTDKNQIDEIRQSRAKVSSTSTSTAKAISNRPGFCGGWLV